MDGIRAGHLARAAAVAAIVLAILAVPVPTLPLAAGRGPSASSLAVALAAPVLTMDPPDWQMPGGGWEPLRAIWSAPAPGCTLEPQWYRWSMPDPPASGTLNATSGPVVEFSGDASQPGRTTIEVRSEAVLDCGTNATLELAGAFGNLTVEPPLALGLLSFGPAPLVPGEVGLLRATVSGGTPPYTVRVNWTDGSFATLSLLSPGAFSLAHAFPAGTFDPGLTVEDAGGLVATAALPGQIGVNGGLAAAIVPAAAEVDAGIPAIWNASVDRAGAWFDTFEECDGLRPSPPMPSGATAGSCTFDSVGENSISLLVAAPLLGASAEVSAELWVAPDPSVTNVTPVGPPEVGRSSYLVASVTGGVPPLELLCAGPAFGEPYAGSIDSDGPVALPIAPASPGQLAYSIVAVDADGVASAPDNGTIAVAPPLNASWEFTPATNGSGPALWALGTVTAGAPPFQWSVVPAVVGPSLAPGAGALALPGPFNWSGESHEDQEVRLAAMLVDAAGATLPAGRELNAVDPLEVDDLVITPVPGVDSATVSLALSDGLPPYNVSIVASDGARWNVSAAQNGSQLWHLDFPGPGVVDLSLLVRDSAGDTIGENGSVVLTGPADPSPDAGLLSDVALVLAASLGIAAVVFLRRRRGRSPLPARPSVDPTAVLRGIIAPADGADRATVEMLAEEAGVPATEARQTLDRLVAEGTVRSEVDEDGSEVLAWERDLAD